MANVAFPRSESESESSVANIIDVILVVVLLSLCCWCSAVLLTLTLLLLFVNQRWDCIVFDSEIMLYAPLIIRFNKVETSCRYMSKVLPHVRPPLRQVCRGVST